MLQKHPQTLSALLLTSLINYAAPSFAQESAAENAPQKGTAISLLFGIEAGPLWSQAGDTAVESSKSGYALGARANLTFSTDKVSLDGGAGWVDSRVSGDMKSSSSGDETTETVRTRFGYAEAAGRYKATRNLELGLLARMSFGTDSTFSTSLEANTTPNVFAGPQLIYDFRSSRSLLSRAGVFALTDISITDRQIFWLGVNFDIGLALTKGDVVVKVQKETKVKYRERNRYIIDADVVNFVTGSSELSDGAHRYLEALGRFLVKNPTIWERLVISGHADQRGSDDLNEQLAQKRADSVKQVLLAQGVPDDHLVMRSFGARDPMEDMDEADVALARNRRVELFFVGKVNVVALRAGLIKVKQVAAKPETCDGNECR